MMSPSQQSIPKQSSRNLPPLVKSPIGPSSMHSIKQHPSKHPKPFSFLVLLTAVTVLTVNTLYLLLTMRYWDRLMGVWSGDHPLILRLICLLLKIEQNQTKELHQRHQREILIMQSNHYSQYNMYYVHTM